MRPCLLITVDTELSSFPRPYGIAARLGQEEWGIGRMLDVFDSLGVKATFFLDAYGTEPGDLDEQRKAAAIIVERGHDLELHTHPGPAFDPQRGLLRQYSVEEQTRIIRLGCERLMQWTGRRPVLHRAGDWAADHRTLRALAVEGFRADFSASPWSPQCSLDAEQIAGNGWIRMDGMLCGVGTCYIDRLTGRVRRVDLGGVSFRESMEVLSIRIDPLILTLHSFSFLRYNRARTRFRPDPDYILRLRRFCGLARDRWGYRILTALEAVEEMESRACLPWIPLPTTRTLSSCVGLLKSVRERLRA